MERKKIIFCALLIAAIFCMIFLPGFSKLQKLREENSEHRRRIQLLEEHNEDLKKELTQMQKDPEYVEKRAREKLGIVRKGEVIYRPKANKQ